MHALREGTPVPSRRPFVRVLWEVLDRVTEARRWSLDRLADAGLRRRPPDLSSPLGTPEGWAGLTPQGRARDARQFLAELRRAVERHPAVNHPLLGRIGQVPFTREDYLVFGLQHYPLVGTFTTYLEHLLPRSPDANAKLWIARVLVDEYGESAEETEGRDHASMYRRFLAAVGAEPGEEMATRLHPEVPGFISTHLRICAHEPFLVGLGAVGPGHEWSIPKMFPPIVRGLRRAGLDEEEILYFTLHLEQDQDHGAWLEEALALYAQSPEAQAQIWRGAMLSLEARARFWSGVQDKLVRWRQPRNLHLRSQARRGGYRGLGELTLSEWRQRLHAHGVAAASHA